MNAVKPISAKQSGNGVRNVLAFFVFALVGIASIPLLQRSYFVQELLFFVGLALLVMFLLVNLIILGLLCRRAWRFVVHNLPRASTSLTTQQKTVTESHSNSFVAAPIANEADTGSA